MTDLSELEALVGRLRHVGSCDRPDGCVCGGDVPAVRSGCGYFTKDSDGLRAAQAIESLLSNIRSQEAALVEAREALGKANDLIECIQQRSSDNMWWVDATDPEEAVSEAHGAVIGALSKLEGGE